LRPGWQAGDQELKVPLYRPTERRSGAVVGEGKWFGVRVCRLVKLGECNIGKRGSRDPKGGQQRHGYRMAQQPRGEGLDFSYGGH
jgi:hypothetical protein